MLKTNPWTCKIKDLYEKKLTGSFYEKEFLLSKLYPENHNRYKTKVILDLSNYDNKMRLRT